MATTAYAQNKDPRLQPKRLSSVGDSITEAVNAEEYNLLNPINPNHWASYANGYRGFWEWLLGRANVNSHNQRITSQFGSSNRANYMEGVSGANSFDLLPQMQQSVGHQATYVPVLMGHNDVCQNTFAEIPTDEEFEANVRAGLEAMRTGLPNGATIYVLAIVDIYKLWQLGDELTSLGLIDCQLIWAATLFQIYPCGTMLAPTNSEADRQYTRSRLIAFNDVLARVVNEYEQNDSHQYYSFTDATFTYTFQPSQVSGFDCFHPSAVGQRDLSRVPGRQDRSDRGGELREIAKPSPLERFERLKHGRYQLSYGRVDVHRARDGGVRCARVHDVDKQVDHFVPFDPQDHRAEDLLRITVDQYFHESLGLAAFDSPSHARHRILAAERRH